MILVGTDIDLTPSLGFAERCAASIERALGSTALSAESEDIALIVSTTKGEDLDLVTPSERLAALLQRTEEPIVVSNACTSGVCAQIVAQRLLSSGRYKAAIVVGCDIITAFIRSGFEALKALSDKPCRPFDAEREGLNLGEAVATMVFADERFDAVGPCWHYEAGSIHNDANHITGPSRTGEGSYRCLMDVMEGTTPEAITAIGLHGTGTVYNDEMESIALHRAGLSSVPANSLKGYYGHTLGAAGLLETILSLRALEQGVILATKGFATQGTSYKVNVSAEQRTVAKREGMQFIKLLSGFGGTNAAVRYSWR